MLHFPNSGDQSVEIIRAHLGLPDSSELCSQNDGNKAQNDCAGEYSRAEAFALFTGRISQRTRRATCLASEAGGALRRDDRFGSGHRKVGRAIPGALLTVMTKRNVSADLKRREQARQTEEGAIGTEEAAPEISHRD